MSEQASVRLDLVVRRRDRFVEASAVWLFLVVLIYIHWMIVLVLFWGILEIPWWSRLPGLMGTGLLVWWGVFSGASEPDGWLYCPDECPIQPLGLLFGRVRAPNLLVVTSGPEPGSVVAEVADPDTAGAIFDMWPVRRQLRFSSAERFLRDGLLPVFRYGVLGRVASSLSLYAGIGAGTLVDADGEFRRLRAMTVDERRRLSEKPSTRWRPNRQQ